MGRPPLNLTAVNVRLDEGVIAAIDQLVGQYGRAKFIREAVANEISKRTTGEGVNTELRSGKEM